jgi:hypothetical protein
MFDFLGNALKVPVNPIDTQLSGIAANRATGADALATALAPQASMGSGIFGNTSPAALTGLDPSQVLAVAQQRGEQEYRNMLTQAGVLDFAKRISGQDVVEQQALTKAKQTGDERIAHIHGKYQLESQRMNIGFQDDALKFDKIKAQSAIKIKSWSDYQQALKDNPASVKKLKAPAKPTVADYQTTGFYKEMIESINAYNQMAEQEEQMIKNLGEADAAKIGAFSSKHAKGLRDVAGMYAEMLGLSADSIKPEKSAIPTETLTKAKDRGIKSGQLFKSGGITYTMP